MFFIHILDELNAFQPFNSQETRDRLELLRRVQSGESLFERSNLSGHFTASAWVVSPDRSQVLMAHHNLYNSWAWLGGHADGEQDLLAVALREVEEESGLIARPVTPHIYSLEILPVSGHEKGGVYIPSHLHLNVTFLLEADPTLPVRSCPGENSRVAWFSLGEAVAASTESWFRDRIYRKLNEKLNDI